MAAENVDDDVDDGVGEGWRGPAPPDRPAVRHESGRDASGTTTTPVHDQTVEEGVSGTGGKGRRTVEGVKLPLDVFSGDVVGVIGVSGVPCQMGCCGALHSSEMETFVSAKQGFSGFSTAS